MTIKACKESYKSSTIKVFPTYKKAYTSSTTKIFSPFKYILCIYYLMQFKKNQTKIWALLNFDSEINIMTLAYAAKLGLKV